MRWKSNLTPSTDGASLRGRDPLVIHFGFSDSGFFIILNSVLYPYIFKIYLDYFNFIRHIVATYK